MMVNYESIVAEVNAILETYTMKLTLRQIYYRLVSKNKIPNTVSSYKRLSKMLVKAREEGKVDDERIEDRSRSILGTEDNGWEDLEDFIKSHVQWLKDSWEQWHRALWKTQGMRVFIALEKDALSRLFTTVADDFNVQVFPTRGYSSYTYVKRLVETLDITKPCLILYFGDYDPSGRDIERDLGDRGERYGGTFDIQRIALTREQIDLYHLPPRPEDAETLAKLARDPRSKTYGTEFAVELDAIEPNELMRLIRAAIMQHIDQDAWDETERLVNEEKETLKAKLATMKVTFEE